MQGKRQREADERLIQRAENRATGLLNLVILLAVAAVAYTDWIVVPNVSLGYLYLAPIALSALVNPQVVTFGLAVVCTILQDVFALPDTFEVRAFRDVIAFAGFLTVGFLVHLIAQQRTRLAAEVRRQRDEYEHDLMLAAQVQQRVLPKPPVLAKLELAASMQTAQLLGGDYYDFFEVSDDIVDVVIADVSGHGAAASLLMPSLAVALRLRARELSGPAAIIKDLDGVLRQITNSATFVTMFYARFEQSSRTLQYASGGHNPPLLLRETGDVLQLESDGPILGILPGAQFSDSVVALEPGDILTLFTDGVTEQENEAGEEFSVERLQAAVQSSQTASAAGIVGRIAETVTAFAGRTKQVDDLTIVVAKVL
jgi:serine phosphatase RsbU (regulator of sigma subunit)